MEALSFRGRPLGVILFEMGPREAEIYDRLRIQISTALQGILLMQRIREHSSELKIANKELQNFAYVVSHDLKAPLRGIARLAHWIVEDYDALFDEEGRKMVKLLVGRTKRLDNLIEGILQYSKVGRTHTEATPIDLNQLAHTVADTLPGDYPNIQVSIHGTFPVVRYNSTRLTQIFQNLISNAMKFLDKPQGHITVACQEQEEDWLISVADNGPGIEERYREKIFQIFQVLTPRDQREKTGVGLAIVKKIIELYHGRIWVESTTGKGATFFFTLPKT
jgi:light-regulated signal transduction histidine kinase (bacteriophytochrome)